MTAALGFSGAGAESASTASEEGPLTFFQAPRTRSRAEVAVAVIFCSAARTAMEEVFFGCFEHPAANKASPSDTTANLFTKHPKESAAKLRTEARRT